MNRDGKPLTTAARALYMLLALTIAAAFWFYVDKFGNNGKAFSARQVVRGIPVEYTGEETLAERGYMLLDEGTTETVDLTFEGERTLVAQLDRTRVRITADLSAVTADGIQTIRYSSPTYLDELGRASTSAAQQFNSVTVKQSVDRVTVNISELASKTVDVRCEVKGNVAEGLSAGTVQLSQSTLEIQGLEEDIAPVSYAKVVLNLGSDAQETITRTLTCQFCDEAGEALDRNSIYPSTDQITVVLPVSMTKTVPLGVNFKGTAGAREWNLTYTIDPEEVELTGDAASLRSLETLNLGTLDLLELVGSTATVHTYHYSISPPEGCALSGDSAGKTTATMRISFKDMLRADVEADRFSIDSGIEGRTVEILTESLTISIFGTASSVNGVSNGNITIVPDLSGYQSAAGVYDVPAVIRVQAIGDVGVLGSYQVQVRIQEEETDEAGETPSAETGDAGNATDAGSVTAAASEDSETEGAGSASATDMGATVSDSGAGTPPADGGTASRTASRSASGTTDGGASEESAGTSQDAGTTSDAGNTSDGAENETASDGTENETAADSTEDGAAADNTVMTDADTAPEAVTGETTDRAEPSA